MKYPLCPRCNTPIPLDVFPKAVEQLPAIDFSKIEDEAMADALRKFEASVWTTAMSFCNSGYSVPDLRKIFYNKRAVLLGEPTA